MNDPFRNYDSWLEAPYQRMYARGEAEEQAWEQLGVTPDELEPPHKAGDSCPRCAELRGLVAEEDGLRCEGCDADIDPDEKPKFDIGDWMTDRENDALERKAEARAEEW